MWVADHVGCIPSIYLDARYFYRIAWTHGGKYATMEFICTLQDRSPPIILLLLLDLLNSPHPQVRPQISP